MTELEMTTPVGTPGINVEPPRKRQKTGTKESQLREAIQPQSNNNARLDGWMSSNAVTDGEGQDSEPEEAEGIRINLLLRLIADNL
jgi:hypothetical protein